MKSPKIIFEDTHLIVLSKPADMLSQGDASGDPNLVDWLRDHFGRNYVGLVHRLDRNVSGLMVVAKRTKAASRLTAALQSGQLVRTYRGWLEGELKEPAVWKDWLLKDPETNKVTVVKESPQAQEAVMQVFPVDYKKHNGIHITLTEFTLDTGRSHQIRVQSAHHGLPLIGDVKYNPKRQIKADRPLLHSCLIRFPHPMSGGILEFRDDLPEDMRL